MKEMNWVYEASGRIKQKMKIVAERSREKIPYTTVNGVFDDKSGDKDICWWTNGFWGGMMWQLYHSTKDPLYREIVENLEVKQDVNLMRDGGMDHDSGFRCVVMFDVNDMKYINDNFGHEKGDEALRLCHQCICEIFGRMGQCYRIGGDEFVLLSEEGKALEAAISRFEKLVEEKAETLDFPFSVALGYAHYSADEDEDFKSTIRRSDEMMYLDKKKKKKY